METGSLKHAHRAYVVLVDDDLDYLITAKEHIEMHMPGVVVFIAENAVNVMQIVFDLDRPAVFLIKYGLTETDSFSLVGHIRKRFRFSSFFYLLLDQSNEELEELALIKFGADPIPKYAADGKYNLGRSFLGRLYYGMQHASGVHDDELTGFASRERGLDLWKHDFARAKRNRKAIGCLYLDLDGLKKVNDTYGHASGDELLLTFSKVLRSCIRSSFDTVIRVGHGDEFFVFFPDVNQFTFKEIQRRIRSSVESASITAGKNKKIHLSVSMGPYLLLPRYMGVDPVAAFDHALKQSDALLYKEKNAKKKLTKS